MNKNNILSYAQEIIKKEIKSLKKLEEALNSDFIKIIDILSNCKGKIILTGIGKSGLICQKISATLSSTGSPSFFLHPAEALHGDLGAVDKNDVIVAVSISGESNELITILPSLKLLADKIIGITTKKDSNLAKFVDLIYLIPEIEEACHLNIAPTSSSTVTLVLGDAIALTLSKLKEFKYEDFAIRHPGGLIGKKLVLKIKDLMHKNEEIPKVAKEASMDQVILEMSSKRLGCTGVFDSNNKLVGIITDGDLRRAIEKYKNIMQLKAVNIMTQNPKTIKEDERALNGLIVMEKYSITNLFVVDSDNNVVGIIHLHDILKSGLRL